MADQLEARADARASFVILDGRLRVAAIQSEQGRSIVADLYRNLVDFSADAAMERGVRLER